MLVVTALIVPVMQARASALAQAEGASVLTQIRVIQPDGSSQENLREAELGRLRAIPGVSAVIPQDTATLYSCDCGEEHVWGATVLAVDVGDRPDGVPSEVAQQLAGNQVIVPSQMGGADLSAWNGREMPASYTEMVDEHTGESRPISVDVVAVYPATWTAPYPDTVFASDEFVTRLLAAERGLTPEEFLQSVGFSRVIVNVTSTEAVDRVAGEIRSMGLDAFPLRDRLGALPDTVEMIPNLIALVGFGALLWSVGFVIFLVRSTLRRRRQELGLLRLRGWTKLQVAQLIAADVSAGAVLGTLAGALLGVAAGASLARLLHVDGGLSQETLAVVLGVWVGLVCLATVTAVGSTAVALRRDPFVEIMAPG